MPNTASFGICVLACARRAAAPPDAPFTQGQALFTDDFHGRFGLRTTTNHLELRNFRVYRITAEASPNHMK